jgi:hypothetical protein
VTTAPPRRLGVARCGRVAVTRLAPGGLNSTTDGETFELIGSLSGGEAYPAEQ